MNGFQPSMKLQSKQREGKKVRCVYDSAKTPLQRLFLSGRMPARKQQELVEVAQALDPIRLFNQLEQLQQALFRCAVRYSPFLSSLPSAPLQVFSVEQCTAGTFPNEGSVPDLAAGLETLYREQERRKRVLGWRRTHKDPFRTLQRGMRKIRAYLLETFEEQWQEEVIGSPSPVPISPAERTARNS
jgi:hypothetical protein